MQKKQDYHLAGTLITINHFLYQFWFLLKVIRWVKQKVYLCKLIICTVPFFMAKLQDKKTKDRTVTFGLLKSAIGKHFEWWSIIMFKNFKFFYLKNFTAILIVFLLVWWHIDYNQGSKVYRVLWIKTRMIYCSKMHYKFLS